MSKFYDYLAEHGPATAADVPGASKPTITDRQNGVWRFRVRGSAAGGGTTHFAQFRAIYYLKGEHEPREVLEAFIDAHPRFVEDAHPRSIRALVHSAAPNDWRPVVNDLFPHPGATHGGGDDW